jgi:hypothetical protein
MISPGRGIRPEAQACSFDCRAAKSRGPRRTKRASEGNSPLVVNGIESSRVMSSSQLTGEVCLDDGKSTHSIGSRRVWSIAGPYPPVEPLRPAPRPCQVVQMERNSCSTPGSFGEFRFICESEPEGPVKDRCAQSRRRRPRSGYVSLESGKSAKVHAGSGFI